MRVEKIFLQYFRAFSQLEVELSDLTLLVGKNGSGKTSVVEALYLLSHGESFRAGKIEEMVAFDEPLARVAARVVDGSTGEGEVDKLEITLTRGMVQGQRAQKRIFSVNGTNRRKQNFVGKFLTVVFQPEDMRLVEGSPGRRRSFLDGVLSMTSAEYGRSLHTYDQALRRYNRLIDQVRDQKQPASVLTYWELLLAKHGAVLQEMREDFFQFLRTIQTPFSFDVRYKVSPISQEAIDSHRDRAIAAGHALVGPHKDDFSLFFPGEELENRELSAYGSRGQQRLGVLWLKIGELQFLEQKMEQQPLLLLDDIFSELDENSEKLVLELVRKYQTVLTTANEDSKEFLERELKGLSVVEMEL